MVKWIPFQPRSENTDEMIFFDSKRGKQKDEARNFWQFFVAGDLKFYKPQIDFLGISGFPPSFHEDQKNKTNVRSFQISRFAHVL